MAKISASAVGTFPVSFALNDRVGAGNFPVQVEIEAGATATYRILGRVSPEAPWVEVVAPASAGSLQSVNYIPFLALHITSYSGAGNINMWIGEL